MKQKITCDQKQKQNKQKIKNNLKIQKTKLQIMCYENKTKNER